MEIHRPPDPDWVGQQTLQGNARGEPTLPSPSSLVTAAIVTSSHLPPFGRLHIAQDFLLVWPRVEAAEPMAAGTACDMRMRVEPMPPAMGGLNKA